MTVRTINRWRGVVLVCLAVFAGVLLSGYLGYRAALATHRQQASSETDLKLCRVIRSILHDGDPTRLSPGDPGYTYYLIHPQELESAKRQYQHNLNRLRCLHLPTVKS